MKLNGFKYLKTSTYIIIAGLILTFALAFFSSTILLTGN